jgi:hypothetical protein
MSWRSDVNVTTIFIAIVVVIFVLAKRIKGEAIPQPKKLFLLPILVSVLGLQDVTHTNMNATDVAVVAVGAVISLGLGLLRGRMDKLSERDGSPWMRWGTASVVILVTNVAAKLALDGVGVLAGGTRAALSSSILLSLGLTLLGEAAIVWMRSGGSLTSLTRSVGQYGGHVQGPGEPTSWPSTR